MGLALACLAATPALADHPMRVSAVGTPDGGEILRYSHADPAWAFGSGAGAGGGGATPGSRVAGINSSCTPVARGTDDRLNEVGSLTEAKIHVAYVYPADGVNNFAAAADAIQLDIKELSNKVAGSHTSAKTIRFDLGTTSDVGCVDITTVRLPRDEAFYSGFDAHSRISADLAPLFGINRSNLSAMAERRNILVYNDQIGGPGAGQADQIPDDDKVFPHFQDAGGQFAIDYGGDYATTNAVSIDSRRETALHEVAHTIGAVQGLPNQVPTGGEFPPHSTGQGHCWDERDIMCYNDGGTLGPGDALASICGTVGFPTGLSNQEFDCGADDYFDPAAVSGDYLFTHWNVYDSLFLCDLTPTTACAPTTPVPPDAAPRTLTVAMGGTGTGRVFALGTDCPGDCTETAQQGRAIIAAAYPAPGSTFSGWSGCDSTSTNSLGTPLCDLTLNDNRTVTASFAPPGGEPAPPAGGGSAAPSATPTPTPAPAAKKKCKKAKKGVASAAKGCKKKKK